MAPKKNVSGVESVQAGTAVVAPVNLEKREALLALIKSKAPTIFEREAAPAFATGNLESFVDEIMKL